MPNPICFIIQQFGNAFFDELYDDCIEIAVKEANALCYRADRILGAQPPLEKIRAYIQDSTLCLAEVTSDNPNVFYEVGWADALKKPTFILWDQSKRSAKDLPFDIRGQAGIPYDSTKTGWRKELRKNLVENITFVLTNSDQANHQSDISIAKLLHLYLAYCDKFSSARTHEWYTGHISNFLKHLGKEADAPASSLKPIQVDEWVHTQKDWGSTYIRGAITALQAAYNWAVERKYLAKNPIKGMEKPKATKRNNPMSIEDYQRLLSLVSEKDSFRDVLILTWNSDIRPEEVRILEKQYIDLERKCIRIPQGVARTGQKPRIIYFNDEAVEILAKLIAKHPKGKLFLNSRGVSWTKFALCNRLNRLSKAINKSYALSDCRNGILSNIAA